MTHPLFEPIFLGMSTKQPKTLQEAVTYFADPKNAFEFAVDVFEIGFERLGMAVADHGEIACAVRAELKDFGAFLGVLLDLAPVGLMDGKLMRPGVAGAQEAVEGPAAAAFPGVREAGEVRGTGGK